MRGEQPPTGSSREASGGPALPESDQQSPLTRRQLLAAAAATGLAGCGSQNESVTITGATLSLRREQSSRLVVDTDESVPADGLRQYLATDATITSATTTQDGQVAVRFADLFDQRPVTTADEFTGEQSFSYSHPPIAVTGGATISEDATIEVAYPRMEPTDVSESLTYTPSYQFTTADTVPEPRQIRYTPDYLFDQEVSGAYRRLLGIDEMGVEELYAVDRRTPFDRYDGAFPREFSDGLGNQGLLELPELADYTGKIDRSYRNGKNRFRYGRCGADWMPGRGTESSGETDTSGTVSCPADQPIGPPWTYRRDSDRSAQVPGTGHIESGQLLQLRSEATFRDILFRLAAPALQDEDVTMADVMASTGRFLEELAGVLQSALAISAGSGNWLTTGFGVGKLVDATNDLLNNLEEYSRQAYDWKRYLTGPSERLSFGFLRTLSGIEAHELARAIQIAPDVQRRQYAADQYNDVLVQQHTVLYVVETVLSSALANPYESVQITEEERPFATWLLEITQASIQSIERSYAYLDAIPIGSTSTPTATATDTATPTPTPACDIAAAEERLQPGYDTDNTGYNAAVTARTTPEERPQRVWTHEFDETVRATVLANDSLYIAAGEAVHRFDACTGENHEMLISSDSDIETLLVQDETLYVGWESRNGGGWIEAFSEFGRESIGSQQLGAKLSNMAFYDGSLYVYTDGGAISSTGPQFARYSADLSTEHWSVDTRNGFDTTPAVTDEGLFAAGSSHARAYELDGSEAWSKGPGGYIHSAPIIADPTVLIAREDEIHVRGTAYGTLVERHSVPWQPFAPGVLTERRLYYGTPSGLLALDRRTFEVVSTIPTEETVRTRPFVSQDIIYLIDEGGELTMLNRSSLEQVDRLQLRLDDAVTLDPYVAAGRLFAFDESRVAVYE